MRTTRCQEKWIPLQEALQDPFVTLTMKQIYNFVHNRILRNGYVVKKGHSNRWEFFSKEDYKKWKHL
jgi:hypothetical protein